ncbi:ABC transporter substrate-binding protein [Nocardioides sp. SR21]|uniref:ABC transporter substrate-binding protein n=1 Tax=Nocardioides sp. SR21 TaxID=2919501 RepID=UPI001FAA2273|nr:ABC transporter substrate-binding protein [Nocardioides sp. SR21]
MTRSRRARLSVGALLPLLALSACGSAPDTDAEEPAAGAAASAFPMTFDSCGTDVTVPAAPERVLSFYPTMTEMMVALGLEDRLVGQVNTQYGTPSEQYADAYDAVRVVAEGEPSAETVIGERPDLLLAEQEWRFDGKRLPTRASYAEDGLPVLVSESLCADTKTETTVPDTYEDLERLGRLFGVEERAADLVAELEDVVAGVQEAVAGEEPASLAILSVYESTLYVQAGGLYTDVVERAGGRNLITSADLPAGEYYAAWSPEKIVRLNPDVIVFPYNDEQVRETALAYIEDRLGTTDAVRGGRVVGVPEPVFGGGVRSSLGVEEVARLLHPEMFTDGEEQE